MGSENMVNTNSQGVSLRCVCVLAACMGIHRQTSGDLLVPAGDKIMLKSSADLQLTEPVLWLLYELCPSNQCSN